MANDVSLQAPASVEEEAALLERMRSSSGDEQSNAIRSLALGGSLEAFEYLLGRKDADGTQDKAVLSSSWGGGSFR